MVNYAQSERMIKMTTIYMLESQSKSQMMSFILKSEDHLLVIDGGNSCDADYLCAYIKKLGGVVDGWFLTHPHHDHCDALSSHLERHPNKINIKRVYYNFPKLTYFLSENEQPIDEACKNAVETMTRLEAQIGTNAIPCTTVHRGDVFEFGEMKITVLREPNQEISVNRPNNASVVYRFEANGKSCIFLGDLGVEGGEELLKITPPELLRADMVQLAHHGQDGVGRPVYDAIGAKFCFWCTPEWLWNNNNGLGYDTHTWKTIVTRGWMSEIGVKWHYISKDGTHEVPLDDMDPTVHLRKKR